MAPNKNRIIKALNPADYFTLAMDEEIRNEGMPGSLCGFALELDKTPDIEELRHRIDAFTQKFPESLAQLQAQGRRHYWYQRGQARQIFFQHQLLENTDEDQQAHGIIEQIINHQEPRSTINPIEFHLLSGHKKHFFMLRWIHPFCDAKGADLILRYLATEQSEDREKFGIDDQSLVDLQLKKYNLWQKIRLFFKAKNYIQELDQLSSITPPTQEKNPENLRYRVYRLSEQQTDQINQEARKNFGLTGMQLYFIACLMRALHTLTPNAQGDAYCAPYAFNLRRQKVLSPVTGNQVCALFAQAPKAIISDRQQLFQHLKQQNIRVIRQQLDYAFLPLMWAGSWLPLAKYGKTLRQSVIDDSERSSFWYSDIGQQGFTGQHFLES
ncbi:MAG: hypothetical protein HAW67_07310, partial [Endozoicomonadaceae bacterium]|nr:hypothetical protein [Endozoicomonadaceae bacterium]